jgi:hypothetical protein
MLSITVSLSIPMAEYAVRLSVSPCSVHMPNKTKLIEVTISCIVERVGLLFFFNFQMLNFVFVYLTGVDVFLLQTYVRCSKAKCPTGVTLHTVDLNYFCSHFVKHHIENIAL